MAQPSLSDAEKRARGTFDARRSESARAKKRAENVVSFPSVGDIPPCDYPLDEKAQLFYNRTVKALHEAGVLTITKQEKAAALASHMTTVRAKLARGDLPRASDYKAIELGLAALERAEADAQHTGPAQAQTQSKFARNGFAGRRT